MSTLCKSMHLVINDGLYPKHIMLKTKAIINN